MNIKIRDNVFYCELNDNIVVANVKPMMQEFKNQIERNGDRFNVVKMDLSKAQSIDSLSITFLISVYKNLLANNKKMILYKVPEPMMQLFKIMKLDEAFEIEN